MTKNLWQSENKDTLETSSEVSSQKSITYRLIHFFKKKLCAGNTVPDTALGTGDSTKLNALSHTLQEIL